MRWWLVTLVLLGLFATGCGRASEHGDPPAGGWQNGATNSQAFFGAATIQFNFKKDVLSPVKDAVTPDTGGGEDVGGPLLLDNL